jgi:outer membrane protein assembly factor BamB
MVDSTDDLLIAGYDQTLHSINPDSGLERWSFTEAGNRYIAAPLVVDEMIYAPNADGTLYALDVNGNLKWEFTSDDPLWASPIWSESCDCVYQVSMDHYLYALDPVSGNLRWKTADLGGPIVSQPALGDNGLIILGTFNNQVLALDENSQEIVWQLETEDWVWASPIIDQEQVYVSDISGNIYAVELETGNTLWKINPGGGIVSAAIVQDDFIYFSTDASSLVVVNRDGVIQRNQPIEGKLYASPAFGSEKIFLAPSQSDFLLLALNQSGVQVWAFPPAE